MRKLILIAILASVSACQQTVDTNIASSGTGLSRPGSIGLGDTVSALDAELLQKVTDSLARRGYLVGITPDYHLDISASHGPISAKVIEASSGDRTKKKAMPWFRKCAPTVYRFGILLTDVKNGDVVYRGEASEEHCVEGDKSVFPHLADASLKDLSAPRGARVEKRSARR
ncbi:hypothetical protein [Sphingorhabdus sp.]|jgi:hypothetical protein|uniref:hypothetical protein n=1 Tax=Sphingorhabdus sp. TaxID=1902408 RepID=UPI003BB00BD6|nr:hypothetical protein [Sphingomonadales bacterium]MBK9433144.1 hypothetical protein [Sphingomonadales bacterium]MBL0021646.1 hypothetical protein [Sphingomonadales bacterium]